MKAEVRPVSSRLAGASGAALSAGFGDQTFAPAAPLAGGVGVLVATTLTPISMMRLGSAQSVYVCAACTGIRHLRDVLPPTALCSADLTQARQHLYNGLDLPTQLTLARPDQEVAVAERPRGFELAQC